VQLRPLFIIQTLLIAFIRMYGGSFALFLLILLFLGIGLNLLWLDHWLLIDSK
jgi:hypothetical protein